MSENNNNNPPKPKDSNIQEAVAVPPTKKTHTSEDEGFFEEPLFDAAQRIYFS